MTTRINIDVKFKTPEAAALGFGLLYHAAGIVQSGCRRQLNEGMADEAVADNFIAHALRDDRAREAAIGLAGRIMEDSLRALANGLELGEETPPIVLDREPAQIVRDGLVGLLAEHWVPAVEILRGWSADLLESAAAWVMSVHDARRTGQADPLLPRALVVEIERGLPQPIVPEPTDEQMADLLGVPVDVVEASNARNLAANRRLASELGLEAVWCDGKLTFQPRAGVDYLKDTGRMNARGELVRPAPPPVLDNEGREVLLNLRLVRAASDSQEHEEYTVYRVLDMYDGRLVGESSASGSPIEAIRDLADHCDWEHRGNNEPSGAVGHIEIPQHRAELWARGGAVNTWGARTDALAELHACAELLGVEAREGCVLDELRARVPSTVQVVVEGGDSKPLEFTGTFEPAAIATYEATGEQRVRLVVDGVTMWASTVTVERFEIPPAIDPDDFTEDDDAIEFYADGEYGVTTVERLTLRIEARPFNEEDEDAEDLYDFTLRADGELHDGHSTLAEVARSYPDVSPSIEAWKTGRTVPFAVVVTAARKLAGLTEPLPEENP